MDKGNFPLEERSVHMAERVFHVGESLIHLGEDVFQMKMVRSLVTTLVLDPLGVPAVQFRRVDTHT